MPRKKKGDAAVANDLNSGVGAGTNVSDVPLGAQLHAPVQPVALIDSKKIAQALMNAADPEHIKLGSDYDESDIPGFVSTGCSPLDYMLVQGRFRGGVPRGRFVEIFGPEGSGKSTLGYEILVATQRGFGLDVEWVKEGDRHRMQRKGRMQPGIGVLNDTERTFNRGRFSDIGGDPDALLYFEGATIEQGFDSIIRLLTKAPKSTPPITFLWDTVSASPVEAELWGDLIGSSGASDDEDDEEEDEGKEKKPKKAKKGGWSEGMSVKPRKMREAFRRVTRLVAQRGALVIFVSQTSTQIGKPAYRGVTPEEATGSGRAIRFASTLRLRVRRKERLLDELPNGLQAEVGVMAEVVAVKSKLCAPFRSVRVPLRYDGGFDDALAIYEELAAAGAFKHGGGWVSMEIGGETVKFRKADWREVLHAKPGVNEWAMAQLAAIYAAPAIRRSEGFLA